MYNKKKIVQMPTRILFPQEMVAAFEEEAKETETPDC